MNYEMMCCVVFVALLVAELVSFCKWL